ncbi:hypothetical protein M0R45_026471 [Rubus argutus]|uniref:Uncharacterized protein n=1 Tax=Rubus argutus TaxID=59490 RepID=A0AAW1WZX9_RUBAR
MKIISWNDTNIRDPNLLNAEFTWSNIREDAVCCRLDRFIFTSEWEELFPNVRQKTLNTTIFTIESTVGFPGQSPPALLTIIDHHALPFLESAIPFFYHQSPVSHAVIDSRSPNPITALHQNKMRRGRKLEKETKKEGQDRKGTKLLPRAHHRALLDAPSRRTTINAVHSSHQFPHGAADPYAQPSRTCLPLCSKRRKRKRMS